MRYASLSAIALLLAVGPVAAEAQAHGRHDRAQRDVAVRVEVGRDSRVDQRVSRRKKGKGPSFCRSGAGHPVFGRRWCRDKGFDLGYDRAGWIRERWDDVRFDRRWYGSRDRILDARILVNLLGRDAYGRLDFLRRRQESRVPLSGRWMEPRRGVRVLQVRSGPTLLAELTDLNGDRRVDLVLVAGR